MELEALAPTFNSLNRSQKRALILRDQLRYLEPHHLDTYIEGITSDEPPTYRKVNGTVVPALALVTLKDTATRFDLGNVLFADENNAVYRVYFTIEDDQVDMHTEEALPKDEANLDSAPIHGFIAKTMIPLLKNKFQAICARQDKINNARRSAYNKPHQPLVQFHDGETLSRLDPSKAKRDGASSQGNCAASSTSPEVNEVVARKSRKRKRGEPVLKHICNQHQRTGLDTIPDDRKSATFNTIPEHVKVDLFNNIVSTAFPNFDNLMMAAWNVVSIYSNVGTDFPELHKSVVELKHVLLDFDEAFEMHVDRTEPEYRQDLDPASRNATGGHRSLRLTPNITHNSAGASGQANGRANDDGGRPQDRNAVAGDGTEDQGTEEHRNMPPPRILQLISQPGDEANDEERPMDPSLSARDEQQRAPRPSPRHASENLPGGSVPSPARSSPAQQPVQTPRDRVKKVRDISREASKDVQENALEQAASPELARRREEYASSIGKANLHSAGAAKALRADDADSQSEHDQAQTPDQAAPLKKKKALADYDVAQLRQKYNDRKAGLIRTYGSLNNIPQQHMAHLQQLEAAIRTRERAEKDEDKTERRPLSGSPMAGPYLGNSVLGPKKPTGMAPVALMLHNRKEASGSNNGIGPGRHGY